MVFAAAAADPLHVGPYGRRREAPRRHQTWGDVAWGRGLSLSPNIGCYGASTRCVGWEQGPASARERPQLVGRGASARPRPAAPVAVRLAPVTERTRGAGAVVKLEVGP